MASFRNLGPKSQACLRGIGILTAEQLARRDPFVVYARLKAEVPGVSLNLLYALIGAIEDCDWREIKRERRSEILLRLDQMGAAPK